MQQGQQAGQAQPELQPVDWSAVKRDAFQRSFLTANSAQAPEKVSAMAELEASTRREKLQIRIEDASEGATIPAPILSFRDLDSVLPSYVLETLDELGMSTPMPIQAQALPLVLSGYDVIGLAQTGSGKTLAFLLPAIVQIEAQSSIGRYDATPIALVLAPTRELAVQISDQATKVLKGSKGASAHRGGLWAACLYGGQSKNQQLRSAYGSQIVVATPGRLKDVVTARELHLHRVTYFTLDEADRMLDLGFQGDVSQISGQVRPERQVLFFSATWQSSVQALAKGLCENGRAPVRISVGQHNQQETAMDAPLCARRGITQEVIVVDHPDNWELQLKTKNDILEKHLYEVLQSNEDHKVLVFVSQKDFADTLCNKLWEDGFQTGAMHSGKAQESRLNTLERFRQGRIRLLIATDVLGRGIDIPSVSHVVIYEMGTVEDYIHRIGRTARGKDAKGHALVFFEYYWKMPEIAGQLVKVLEESEQPVPQALLAIVKQVDAGERKGTKAKQSNREWAGRASTNWKEGRWNGSEGDGSKDWKQRGSRDGAWSDRGSSNNNNHNGNSNSSSQWQEGKSSGWSQGSRWNAHAAGAENKKDANQGQQQTAVESWEEMATEESNGIGTENAKSPAPPKSPEPAAADNTGWTW